MHLFNFRTFSHTVLCQILCISVSTLITFSMAFWNSKDQSPDILVLKHQYRKQLPTFSTALSIILLFFFFCKGPVLSLLFLFFYPFLIDTLAALDEQV